MLIFSPLDQKYPFGANLIEKNKTYCKLKFCTETNLNMQSSMMMLIFSPLDQKHHFWANLAQTSNLLFSA